MENYNKLTKNIIHALGEISHQYDLYTGLHVKRTARYAKILAKKIGYKKNSLHDFELACFLHDIGKIGIPQSILRKKGKLSDEEFEIMKTHSEIGAKILSKFNFGIFKMAKKIALDHHERYDGTGYPRGLVGKKISIEGRILAAADVFDALMSKRAYKDEWSFDEAIDELKNLMFTHLDGEIVMVLLKNKMTFKKEYEKFKKMEEKLGI